MLITREPSPETKTQFRIRMNDSVYNEITAYCNWASIHYRDYFIEQACKYIFDHDEQWKEFKKAQADKQKE